MKLADIRIDGGTQARTALDESAVSDYAGAVENGEKLPPMIVFFDGSANWLADGFHRFYALIKAGKTEAEVEQRTGTRRDAILFSVGANAAHGLRRTNADKRKAIETLLADEEWATWTDREIARHCAVGHPLVAQLRKPTSDVTGISSSEKRKFTTKHGTQAVMNTGGINKGRPASTAVETPDADAPAEHDAPTETEVLREQLSDYESLVADNDQLRRVVESDDVAKGALAEAVRFKELARVLQERVDGLMNEKNEYIKAAKRWQRKCEALEKQIKETAEAEF